VVTIIETARLILRPWRADDVEELEQLFADPAVRKGRHLPPERVMAIAQSSLQQWQRNGFDPWAAQDRATGQWIGRMGLDELDDWPDTHKIEVGWELHRAWWGKGLATEAGLAALRFGFEEHQLERIISVTAPWNTAARRVMERIGLEEQGVRQWKGMEVVCYALDRVVWQVRGKREGHPLLGT
jgi:[ribosomal protein S5]-alanine N-acetyltransferase